MDHTHMKILWGYGFVDFLCSRTGQILVVFSILIASIDIEVRVAKQIMCLGSWSP